MIARGGSEGEPKEISFMPALVLLQDFTGVPAVVDMAAADATPVPATVIAMSMTQRDMMLPPERRSPPVATGGLELL